MIKASKKLDKYLSDVNEIVKEESKESGGEKKLKKDNIQYKDLYLKYSFFNTMLKSSVNFNNEVALKESQNSVRKTREKIFKSDIDILNICILERDEIETNSKIKKYEEFFLDSQNQKLDINNDDLLMVYFYLYNKISSLTQNIINKINIEEKKSQKEIEEIRNLVSKIIDSTKKQIKTYQNNNIKKLFRLPIFKNLFNRIYYVKMYSYYLEGKYKECVEYYQEYDNIDKNEFELRTPKSNEYIMKLVADCYFKQKEYKEAKINYEFIINTGTNDPLIYFNYGLTLYLYNNLPEAIKALEQSANLYKKDNKIGNVKTVAELIAKIKKEEK
jgi:tetratricopeptide (TPR) repeat protein